MADSVEGAEILKVANLLKRSRNRTAISALGGVNWQCKCKEACGFVCAFFLSCLCVFLFIVVRRVTLTSSRISYGAVDGPLKGFIPIDSSTKCEGIVQEGKDYAFRVVTGGDELILNAANGDNRKEWLEAIRSAPSFSSLSACNVEAVMDLAAEMDRVRVEKERIAQQEVDSMLASKARDEQREQLGKKLAQDLAEKKRKEAALLLVREAEAAAARAALHEKVKQPVLGMKKLASESSFKERYMCIDIDTGDFLFGKAESEINYRTCKSFNISALVKSVTVNDEMGKPNFSILFRDGVDVPESVVSKSIFRSGDKVDFDVTMEDPELCSAFVSVIEDFRQK